MDNNCKSFLSSYNSLYSLSHSSFCISIVNRFKIILNESWYVLRMDKYVHNFINFSGIILYLLFIVLFILYSFSFSNESKFILLLVLNLLVEADFFIILAFFKFLPIGFKITFKFVLLYSSPNTFFLLLFE